MGVVWMRTWCESCGKEVTVYTGDPPYCPKCGEMAEEREEDKEEKP